MTGHHLTRVTAVAVPLLCIHACLHAEEIVTKSGKVLKNADIVSIEGDRIIIKYDGGTAKFAATEIPDKAQKRFRDQELKRKADEVEKLKQELARNEKELQQLKQNNQRLRRDTEQKRTREADEQVRRDAELRTLKAENERLARESKRPVTTLAPVVANPTRPIQELAEFKADDVIDAKDMVLYYRADPAAADPRFRKKTFQIKGVVERFEPKMFRRLYEVLLESPDKSVRVVCKFTYAEKWNAVYTKERGRFLIVKEGASEMRFMKTGDTLTIRARCEGLKGSDLEFTRCQLVR